MIARLGRGLVLCCLAGVSAGACNTWQPAPRSAGEPASWRTLPHLRLTLRDSTRIELRDVVVSRDSVTGNAGPREAPLRVGYARADVVHLETLQPDAVQATIGVSVIVAALVATYVYLQAGRCRYGGSSNTRCS